MDMATTLILCAARIDQGRYIGNDPVGFQCSNYGTQVVWIDGLSWHLCDRCKNLLASDPARVTLPMIRAMPGGE